MDKDTAIDLLVKRWQNAGDLRAEFPGLEHWLRGEFDNGPFNSFEQSGGLVVSRRLVQTPKVTKDPTVGLIGPIAPGERYTFNTGAFTENLIVLCGNLKAGMNGEPLTSLSERRSIIVPAGHDLKLATNMAVFYVCHYHPK